MLVCSLTHLVGAIRKRGAIKLIASSLVVSSCCLIANGTILRSILKSADPLVIANLDPKTIIIDVDRRGWISHNNYSINQTAIKQLLESRLKRHSSTPIIICADRRTKCSKVWRIVESCREVGATRVSLATLQSGFDRYSAPIFNEKSIPPDIQTNQFSSVLVYRCGFVLNDNIVPGRDMERVMNENIKQQTGHWYSIMVADAPYQYVQLLLQVFQDSGTTNLVLRFPPIPVPPFKIGFTSHKW